MRDWYGVQWEIRTSLSDNGGIMQRWVGTRWWMVFIKDAVKDWKAKTLFKVTIMKLEWVLEDVTGHKRMDLAKVEV